MLGGIGGEITGQVIDQGAPRGGELRGAGDHIRCLEKPGYFHGDDTVAAGQGIAVADAGADRLIDRPVGVDQLFGVKNSFVDDLRAGGAGIAVNGMDARPDATGGKGDVALKYMGLSCII